MDLLKSTIPYVVELSPEDIYVLHNACHHYKKQLKQNPMISRQEKRRRLETVNRIIVLVDLMV